MSRRVIAIVLTVVMVVVMLPIQGCQVLSSLGIGGTTAEPFTTNYTLTQADYDFFVGDDTVDTAIAHSPFYPGNQPLPSQNTAAYEDARYKKVGEIIADAATLVAAAKAAEPALTTLRSDYVMYLQQVAAVEPKASAFIGSSLTSVTAAGVDEILAERAYAGLMATEATTSYAATMRDYLRVTCACQYGALLLQDGNTIAASAAILSRAIATDGDAGAKTAAATFDGKATKDVADAVAALEPVAEGIDRVNQGLSLLASGDYYFSREALGWMASETAKLQPQVDALTAHGAMTQQQVDDVKTTFSVYQQWNAALTQKLAALDTSGLVAVKGAAPLGVMPWLDTAYAAEGASSYTPGKDYASAVTVLSQGPAPRTGLLSATWDGVKSVFGAAKTGAGLGLDTAAVGMRNISTLGCNWWYGVPVSESWKQMKENVKEIGKNYDAGVSGSAVLNNANGYLEGVENGAGNTAGGWARSGIESTWGKGTVANTTGWAVGGLFKITTGMFTGFAKGVYKVANTQSSSADVASGIVEIGLSCIGGSKVLIKGTQVPGLLKGGYQGLKNASQALVNLAESAGDAKIRAQLAKEMADILANNQLTKDQVSKLISNSVKVEISEAVAAMMARNREMYIKAIRDLIAAGGAGFKTNFVSTAKNQISDLVSKSFSATLQGFLNAGTTVMGTGLGDYIDNVIGSQLDPMLTDLINAALAIPPDPGQVDGSYAGSLVVTKVDIPDAYQKQAQQANCAALFKQLEGKAQSITLQVSATGGTATMGSKSGSSKGPCDYSDGTITMSFASNGATLRMQGTAKLTKEGLTMGGSWSMPYPKTQIMISGTWSVAKK